MDDASVRPYGARPRLEKRGLPSIGTQTRTLPSKKLIPKKILKWRRRAVVQVAESSEVLSRRRFGIATLKAIWMTACRPDRNTQELHEMGCRPERKNRELSTRPGNYRRRQKNAQNPGQNHSEITAAGPLPGPH